MNGGSGAGGTSHSRQTNATVLHNQQTTIYSPVPDVRKKIRRDWNELGIEYERMLTLIGHASRKNRKITLFSHPSVREDE